MARQAPARVVGRRLRALPTNGWLRLAVIACATLAVALALLARILAPAPDHAQALVGHVAPPFSATAAQSGKTLPQPVTFDGHAAHPTLLVFFDTLCVHCLAGVQTVRAVTQASDQPPLNVMYIDAPGENAEITGQYMARLQFDPPVLLDQGARIASRYGVAYYPSFVLVDSQGAIRAVWTGAPTASEIQAAAARG